MSSRLPMRWRGCFSLRSFGWGMVTLLAIAVSLSGATSAGAATATTPDTVGTGRFEKIVRTFLEQQTQTTQQGATADFTRVAIQVGTLDSRVQLAPCNRIEPYLPSGARVWGRTMVGLRCSEGARWNILIPATVSVWGLAAVAAGPLATGTILGAHDVQMQEVELSRERSAIVRVVQALEGRTLARSFAAGQPILENALRTTPVLAAGDPVRLRISGPGFEIAAQGVALAPAGEGQPVRIRTEQGKVISGVAREGRIVDVKL